MKEEIKIKEFKWEKREERKGKKERKNKREEGNVEEGWEKGNILEGSKLKKKRIEC